jgi:nucleoside-diphosphate-sugar epimerase
MSPEEAVSLAGRTILVTGASGFLGSHLCTRLTRKGARVHATSRVARQPPLTWWKPDLENVAEVRELIARVEPEVIYHLAGRVTAAADRDLVLPTYHSLLTTTVNVLTAASDFGRARVVLVGSLTEPLTQDEPPTSPYSAAKWATTQYGRMFHSLYGLDAVIIRPFWVYGPGQHPSKVVPYVAGSLLRGQAPRLSSGRVQGDWIHVDDVVEGFVLAGSIRGIGGADIDLGSGTLVSLRAVVEKIAELVGAPIAPAFGVLPDRPLLRPRKARASAAKRLLNGWQACVSLDEGLRRTVEHLRAEARSG